VRQEADRGAAASRGVQANTGAEVVVIGRRTCPPLSRALRAADGDRALTVLDRVGCYRRADRARGNSIRTKHSAGYR
jgi:hypothetical protein